MNRLGWCFVAASLCAGGTLSAQAPEADAAPAPVAAPTEPVAAPTEPAPTAEPEPTDQELHQGLRRLQAIMEKALNARDIDTIVAHVDERVVFTTMNGDVVRGRKGVRDYFARMMEGPNKVVESVTSHFEADDLSLLHGKGLAVAFGHTNDHYVLVGGEAFDIQARWSGTILRKNGAWRIASFHYSASIFDNPVLDMQRRTLLSLAALAFLLSGGFAFWIGRRQGRGSAA